jgi:hypothetical protein
LLIPGESNGRRALDARRRNPWFDSQFVAQQHISNQNSPEQPVVGNDGQSSFAKRCKNRMGSQADCVVSKKRRSRVPMFIGNARRIGTAAGRER